MKYIDQLIKVVSKIEPFEYKFSWKGTGLESRMARSCILQKYGTLKIDYLVLLIATNRIRLTEFYRRRTDLRDLLTEIHGYVLERDPTQLIHISSIAQRTLNIYFKILTHAVDILGPDVFPEIMSDYHSKCQITPIQVAKDTLERVRKKHGSVFACAIENFYDDPTTTLADLGRMTHLSRERVRQLVKLIHSNRGPKVKVSATCSVIELDLCRCKLDGFWPVNRDVLTDGKIIVSCRMRRFDVDRLIIYWKELLYADLALFEENGKQFWIDFRSDYMKSRLGHIGKKIYIHATEAHSIMPIITRPVNVVFDTKDVSNTDLLVRFYGANHWFKYNKYTRQYQRAQKSCSRAMRRNRMRVRMCIVPPRTKIMKRPARLFTDDLSKACRRLQFDKLLTVEMIAEEFGMTASMVKKQLQSIFRTLSLTKIRQPMDKATLREYRKNYTDEKLIKLFDTNRQTLSRT